MAAWFGATQTLTSISKSVTTVASGMLGLEANLATFIQKVAYYEKFFARMEPNLPIEVITTASRLIARCYEYRGEIRDELESSLAYVADAGRWVVGMEDWNAKMEKRLGQISELVLLANTLLVEYAVTGQWGAQGSKDALDGYLRHIAASVILHNSTTSQTTTQAMKATAKNKGIDAVETPSILSPVTDGIGATDSPLMSDNEGDLSQARTGHENIVGQVEDGSEAAGKLDGENSSSTAADDDDDALNPFAHAYQPPVSIESSVASLRTESDTGSVYFNAVDAQQQGCTDRDDETGGEPDSPVSLGEYECLEMESIPQHEAFKPTALSRKRRLQQQFFGGPTTTITSTSTSPSTSIASLTAAPVISLSNPSPNGSPRSVNGIKRRVDPLKDRQRLMDLTYSYDFQRELTFNPFASPGMASRSPTEGPLLPSLQDSSVQPRIPTVEEEETTGVEMKEQTFGHDRQFHHDHASQSFVGASLDLEGEGAPLVTAEVSDVDLSPLVTSEVDQTSLPVVAQVSPGLGDLDGLTDSVSVSLSNGNFGVYASASSDPDDRRDSSSSIDSDELAAVFHSAPDEFARLLCGDDEDMAPSVN